MAQKIGKFSILKYINFNFTNFYFPVIRWLYLLKLKLTSIINLPHLIYQIAGYDVSQTLGIYAILTWKIL